MLPNFLNFVLLSFFLLLVITKPRAAVTIFLSLLLLLPPQFHQFGFGFEEGRKYISNFVIFTFLFVAGYFIQIRRLEKRLTAADIILLTYLCLVLISTLFVTKESVGLAFVALFVRRIATFPLFFFVGKFYMLSNKTSNLSADISHIAKLLMFVGAYISVFGLIEYLTIYNVFADLTYIWTSFLGSAAFRASITNEPLYDLTGFYRYSGVYVESTESAMMLLVILCLLRAKNTFKDLNFGSHRILLMVLIGGMIVLNGTRAVIIAMLAVFLIRPLLIPRLRKYYVLGGAILFSIGIIFGERIAHALTESPFYESRISNEETYLTRIYAWQQTIELIQEHPILGIGVGTPLSLFHWEDADMYTTHNFYLDKIVFTGALGSIFFISLIVVILRKAKYLYQNHPQLVIREYAIAYLSVLVGLSIVYMANMEKPTSGCVFWFLSGMIDYLKDMNKYALSSKSTC